MRLRSDGLAELHQLERDRRLEHQVVGAPDVAHAAAADARDHPVAAGEHVARRKILLLRDWIGVGSRRSPS